MESDFQQVDEVEGDVVFDGEHLLLKHTITGLWMNISQGNCKLEDLIFYNPCVAMIMSSALLQCNIPHCIREFCHTVLSKIVRTSIPCL